MALIIPFQKKENQSITDFPEDQSHLSSSKVLIHVKKLKAETLEQQKLNSVPIISLNNFKQKKQEQNQLDDEIQNLREGLILKIHQYRKNLLKSSPENCDLNYLNENFLIFCAEYTDYILNTNNSVLNILNKYEQFKKEITKFYNKLIITK